MQHVCHPCSSSLWIQILVTFAMISVAFSLNLQFRSASPNDISLARRLILKAKMNPLSITQKHLLVAYDKNLKPQQKGEPTDLVGFGQIRPLNDEYSELASLYVVPECRQQGVGSELIQRLLARHDAKYASSSATTSVPRVCLLTIRPTVPLYQRLGFEEVTDISTLPLEVQFEYKAGSLISKVLSNELVCMARNKNP